MNVFEIKIRNTAIIRTAAETVAQIHETLPEIFDKYFQEPELLGVEDLGRFEDLYPGLPIPTPVPPQPTDEEDEAEERTVH